MNSYWIDSTQKIKKTYPKLSKNINVDICIIGGGLVGITSAYFLSNSRIKDCYSRA